MGYIIIGLLLCIAIAFVYFAFFKKDSNYDESSFFKNYGINTKTELFEKYLNLVDEDKIKIKSLIRTAQIHDCFVDLPEAIMTIKIKDLDYELLMESLKTIHTVDLNFTFSQILKVAAQGADTDVFARAWADQFNAGLKIEFDSALRHISQGNDFEKLVSVDLMAKRAGLDVDEKRFIDEGFNDSAFTSIIYALIRAKNSCIYMTDEDSLKINKANVNEYWDTFKITPRLLKDLYKINRNVTMFTNTMIRAHEAGVKLCFSIADLFSLSDNDFDSLVSNLIKVSKFGLGIDQEDLIRQNISGSDINKLVSSMIKAKNKALDLDFSELMKYHVQTSADVAGFVNALDYSQQKGLGFVKDDLIELSRPGTNIFNFVKAVDVAGNMSELKISRSDIEKQFLDSGEVLNVVNAVIDAKNKGLNLSFKLACQIQKSDKYTLASAINWALNPQIAQVNPSLTIVTKEGVRVTPKTNITVCGKLPLIFAGYDFTILFQRINEAIVDEIEYLDNHEEVLKNLPAISQKVLEKINNEQSAYNPEQTTELNKYCSYTLLDVNIYDLEVGENVKAEQNLRAAEIRSRIHKIQAESDKAKAEAEIRMAMVEQYRNGTIKNFNELHKDNLLNDKKGKETLYNEATEN